MVLQLKQEIPENDWRRCQNPADILAAPERRMRTSTGEIKLEKKIALWHQNNLH